MLFNGPSYRKKEKKKVAEKKKLNLKTVDTRKQ